MSIPGRIAAALNYRFRRHLVAPALEFAEMRQDHKPLPTAGAGGVAANDVPRIALVKQDVYQDLYCCAQGASPLDLVFSSLKRTGPVGLFSRLGADFWIVETEDDEECSVWTQKVFDCGIESLEFFTSLKSEPFLQGSRGHRVGQAFYSVPAEQVDWGQYDIVISLDIAVPERVTRRFPGVVWCYYIGEPGMPAYTQSQHAPIRGYDLFLNQRFRSLRILPRPAAHEVEFPYFLQYYGCFHDLLADPAGSESGRTGVFLESHTAKALAPSQIARLEEFGPVRKTGGTTEEIVRGMMQSKYFVQIGSRMLFGNAMIEAIAAGCLAIGNPAESWHKSLFTPATVARSFEDVVERLTRLDQEPGNFEREASRQRSRIDYLCFQRPLGDLFSKASAVRGSRPTS